MGQSRQDFFLANRSLSGWTVAGSILLTNISTVQFIGLNGSAYQWGAIFIAWEVIAVFGMILSAKVFLPHYYSSGVSTIPEFVGLRFGPYGRTILAVLVTTSVCFIYLPTLVYSSTVLFSNMLPSWLLSTLSENHRFLWIAVILVLIGNTYIFFGGMKFIAISDSVVACIFALCGVLLALGCFWEMGSGNIRSFFEALLSSNRERLNPFGAMDSPVPWNTLLTGLLLINVQVWGTAQGLLQRALAAKSLAEAQKGVLLAALGKLIVPFFVIVPGMLAYDILGGSIENPDSVVVVLGDLLYPGYGVLLIGILSFLLFLTSFNSNMHSMSTLFINDILSRIPKGNRIKGTPLYATSGVIISLTILLIVPNIYALDDAFFIHMKQNEAFFNISILFVVLNSITRKSVSIRGLLKGIATLGALHYGLSIGASAVGVELNWMNTLSTSFVIVYFLTSNFLAKREYAVSYELKTNWKPINVVSLSLSGIVLLWYGGLFGLAHFAG